MARFNRRGNTGVYYVPAAGIANPAAPTATEINAGTALHEVMAAWTGFTSEQADLPVPDLGSTWEGTIPGGETPAASSITFYAGDQDADTEETVRAALDPGDTGYIVVVKRAKAPVAADPADVFPVRVKAQNDEYTVDNAAARFNVGFTIYDPPSKNVDIAV
jgi:hypothetical protein